MNLSAFDKSRTQKNHDKGTGLGLKYAISSMQGWRYEMEDAHCAKTNIYGFTGWSFFAVFDGHGGSYCSQKSSEMLPDEVFNQILKKADLDINVSQSIDNALTKLSKLSEDSIVDAIKEGFYSLDRKLQELDVIKREEDKSGTTVVACLLTPKLLFLINCGDSRAIFIKGDQIELNTFDHKPTQLKERERIQNAGGLVALHRVNGGLATSRGLGDFEYKNVKDVSDTIKFTPNRQYVSSEPDVFYSPRDAQDKFVILACDGVWDVVKNEDVKEYFSNKINTRNVDIQQLEVVNDELLDSCLEKGSRDNMSIISIFFSDDLTRMNSASDKKIERVSSSRPNKNY